MRTGKLRTLVAAGAGAALILLASCSSAPATNTANPPAESPPAADGITIGISFDHFNATRQAEIDGLEAAAKDRGVELIRQVAEDSAETQAAQIQTMIDSNGVDAIIAVPVNFDQFVASVAYATSKNVPVVVMDHPVPDTSMIAFQVTGDPVADGKLAGQSLVDTGEPQKVIELIGALTDGNAIGRRDGFAEAIAGSKVELAQQIPTDWVVEKALNGLTNALQVHPDVTAIYTPSDYLLPAVQSALESVDRWAPAGDPKHVKIISIDGDENACNLLETGYLTTVIVTLVHEFGPASIDAAIAAINGEEIDPKVVGIPGLPVTSETLEQHRDVVWGCP